MESMFEPPGPGSWALDRSHWAGGATPIGQALLMHGMPVGTARVFAEMGAPIDRIDPAFVRGFNYTRIRPLIGGDKPATKLPPLPILKIATRLHPEFRRRAKHATRTLESKPFLDVVATWENELRPRLRETNLEFQQVDLAALTDAELNQHFHRLVNHCCEQIELHFWLHGHDLAGIARLVHQCEQWGIAADRVAEALVGASPSTARPTEILVRLRSVLEAADADVRTLDDVRAAGPEAAALLDEYLIERGSVLATGYDLTALTLAELPGTIVSSIRNAKVPDTADAAAVAAELRAQVPDTERARFDELLADARAVMDMRDDNGPLTIEWPMGLLRLTLLEMGRRLTVTGIIIDPEHTLELTLDEARTAFSGGVPDARAIAKRAEQRRADAALDPPPTLGPPEPEPPLDVLPKPLAELTAMVQAVIRNMGMDGTTNVDPMVGAGVGSHSYTGRACVASSADDAIEKLEPGEVLVVRATSPAFNVVLSIAGAVVTSDGGALSHAAVLARELGIPAVVGAAGALTIPDGATVRVDPVAGRVEIVDPAA